MNLFKHATACLLTACFFFGSATGMNVEANIPDQAVTPVGPMRYYVTIDQANIVAIQLIWQLPKKRVVFLWLAAQLNNDEARVIRDTYVNHSRALVILPVLRRTRVDGFTHSVSAQWNVCSYKGPRILKKLGVEYPALDRAAQSVPPDEVGIIQFKPTAKEAQTGLPLDTLSKLYKCLDDILQGILERPQEYNFEAFDQPEIREIISGGKYPSAWYHKPEQHVEIILPVAQFDPNRLTDHGSS